ncbi:MAG TPA: cupin domain-containing protein, partial [Burkholderiales bacterium]|nr:cupin domain-containing protein [Burkholderiales bacterium]
MTALTPKDASHAGLPPLASRFVDPANIPWEDTRFAGVRQKVLVVDRESGVATVLIHMAPGARLPDHEHVMLEQTYVLEGSLMCGEGECKAGEFVWRPAGSRHSAWGGPQGGLMLAIFQIANRFFEADGR